MKSNIFITFFCTLFLTSCSDFLEVEPESIKPATPTTVTDAQAFVDGIYASLRPPYDKTGFANLPWAMLEVTTGQYIPQSSDQAFTEEIYNLNFAAANPYFQTWWESSYVGIETANISLSVIPELLEGLPQEDQATRNRLSQLMGEAYFLRAYFYFNLVRIYGEVPLKTTPTESEGDGTIPKSTVAAIYEQIEQDLLAAEAESGFPERSDEGRASKGAARALLAKVYLTQGEYGSARDKAAEVISSGDYALFTSDGTTWFDKLNDPNFDNQEEYVFMVQYALNLVNNSFSVWFVSVDGLDAGLLSTGPAFEGMVPSSSLIDFYDPSDLRVQNRGFFFDREAGSATQEFTLQVYKHYDATLQTSAPFSGKNIPIIRYSDVLLTYAEAQNRADGGPNTQAYDAINSIRARAGLDPLSGLNEAEFEEAVWKERYLELTAEGQVWFDMVRTGKIYDGSDFVDLIGYTLPTSGATFSADNLLFPIPQNALDTNPLLNEPAQ
jgi:ABC-type cobalt transport system substrate-binding protein